MLVKGAPSIIDEQGMVDRSLRNTGSQLWFHPIKICTFTGVMFLSKHNLQTYTKHVNSLNSKQYNGPHHMNEGVLHMGLYRWTGFLIGCFCWFGFVDLNVWLCFFLCCSMFVLKGWIHSEYNVNLAGQLTDVEHILLGLYNQSHRQRSVLSRGGRVSKWSAHDSDRHILPQLGQASDYTVPRYMDHIHVWWNTDYQYDLEKCLRSWPQYTLLSYINNIRQFLITRHVFSATTEYFRV